jgi:hypothetical protein
MVFAELEPPLPVICFLVEGKTVSDAAITGQITRLATTAAEVTFDEPIVKHMNFKLVLSVPEAAALPEFYAKVLELDAIAESPSSSRACVSLTSVPPETRAFLEQLRAMACAKEHMRVG